MKTILIFLLFVTFNLCSFPQQNQLNWQHFQDSINALEDDSLYETALEFLSASKKYFSERWFELSKEEIFLNEKLGIPDKNLAIFNAAHQKGFFYLIHPNLPKYKDYKELEGFSEISKRDLELRDSANSKSEMIFDVVYPPNYEKHNKYPVILIFHGGGSNLEMVKEHWQNKQLNCKFIKIYLQNYLHYDSKTFGWRSGDEKAFDLLKSKFNEFQKNNQIQKEKIFVSGISAGGTFAIEVAVRQIIPATGFITFCPGIPQILGPGYFKDIGRPDVKGFIIGGENDYYLERQKQMMNVFNEIGIQCRHEIVKNMGHEYPENEKEWITSALKYLEVSPFIGFWEGPHPVDIHKKFYTHINFENDSLKAKGYWTNNCFYQESFKVDNIEIISEYLSFFIPDWNCTYKGTITDENHICGGFECLNEPIDSVNLVKNNAVKIYLTEPYHGSNEDGFSYYYTQPEKLDDKISVAYYQTANDSAFIYSMLNEIIQGDYGRLNSFLLFKNNHLVCEEYFYGYQKNDVHPIESCTKSITSLLIGIAKDKGYIKDLNEPLSSVFPEYKHLKQGKYYQITIQNLLTMTSGFNPDIENLFRSGDRIAFALKRDGIAKPGEKFQYDGGNTEILGGILKKQTGMYADEFAKKYLFEPLGITNYNWEINKQNGYPSMAGALELQPRDMGKLGLLILNSGTFSGNQVVSEEWIAESTSVKTNTHIPGDDYSYQWWNLHLKSDGKTYECIWANGWGSQFIYIFPELKVVIVTTGHNYEGDSWTITNGISKYLYLLEN